MNLKDYSIFFFDIIYTFIKTHQVVFYVLLPQCFAYGLFFYFVFKIKKSSPFLILFNLDYTLFNVLCFILYSLLCLAVSLFIYQKYNYGLFGLLPFAFLYSGLQAGLFWPDIVFAEFLFTNPIVRCVVGFLISDGFIMLDFFTSISFVNLVHETPNFRPATPAPEVPSKVNDFNKKFTPLAHKTFDHAEKIKNLEQRTQFIKHVCLFTQQAKLSPFQELLGKYLPFFYNSSPKDISALYEISKKGIPLTLEEQTDFMKNYKKLPFENQSQRFLDLQPIKKGKSWLDIYLSDNVFVAEIRNNLIARDVASNLPVEKAIELVSEDPTAATKFMYKDPYLFHREGSKLQNSHLKVAELRAAAALWEKGFVFDIKRALEKGDFVLYSKDLTLHNKPFDSK